MILITGGAGYIGSHIALAMIENGLDVVIFDNLESGHKETTDILVNTKAKGKVVSFTEGDLKNSEDISNVFEKYKIDAVIHAAASISVEESVREPQKYYFNNVVGSINLLNSMRKNNVNKIVFSSTAAVYGEPKYVPIDENHCRFPINTYGKSKMIVEEILKDYDVAYGLKSISLRYFNVAGADSKFRIGEYHEPETHLIPNILAASANPKHIFRIHGDDYNTKDGTCIRDYVNIEDLADAHILAIKYLMEGGNTDCFNLGTNSGNSIKEVIEVCEKVIKKEINKSIEKRRSGDPEILVACSKKAQKILGWHPKKTLQDSILTHYNWKQSLRCKD